MKIIKCFEDFILKTDIVMDIHFENDKIQLKSQDDENDENVVGFIHYRYDKFKDKKSINIIDLRIYVKGVGYGDKTMSLMENIALHNNCEFIHLKVLSSNIPAINLYKKHNFIEYKSDYLCIFMFKEIKKPT